MGKYKKIFKEDLSYLTLYRHGEDMIMKFIDVLAEKVGSDKLDTCRALVKVFDAIADEMQIEANRKQKEQALKTK
jgi:hypothetical protein